MLWIQMCIWIRSLKFAPFGIQILVFPDRYIIIFFYVKIYCSAIYSLKNIFSKNYAKTIALKKVLS